MLFLAFSRQIGLLFFSNYAKTCLKLPFARTVPLIGQAPSMKTKRRIFLKNTLLGGVGAALSLHLFARPQKGVNNLYVSIIDGNDNNPGTLAQPFKTIQKAANIVQAGQNIIIKAGVYNERIVLNIAATQQLPINIAPFAHDEVIIDGTGITWFPANSTTPFNGLFDLFNCAYITVSDLTIIHSTYAGFFMEDCTNITIQNCQTDDTVSSGIGVWTSSNITISNNRVHLACNGGGEECITISTSSFCEVKHNEVLNNGSNGLVGGEGIDAKQGSHHIMIHHNHIHHLNSRLGIYADAYDTFTHDIEIFNNRVHDCSESGIAVASEGGGLLQNVKIYNNIVYNNLYGGIEIGGWTTVAGTTVTPIDNVTIINNSLHNNGDGINFDNAHAQNIVARNNICSQSNGLELVVGATPLAQITIENNLIDGNTQHTGSAAVVASAGFVAAPNQNFHLQSNSSAINAGSTNLAPVKDYDGNSRDAHPDIGAFEFSDMIFKHGFED